VVNALLGLSIPALRFAKSVPFSYFSRCEKRALDFTFHHPHCSLPILFYFFYSLFFFFSKPKRNDSRAATRQKVMTGLPDAVPGGSGGLRAKIFTVGGAGVDDGWWAPVAVAAPHWPTRRGGRGTETDGRGRHASLAAAWACVGSEMIGDL
jgi:hypothetical protein